MNDRHPSPSSDLAEPGPHGLDALFEEPEGEDRDPVALLRNAVLVLVIVAVAVLMAAVVVNWLSVRPRTTYVAAPVAAKVAQRYDPATLHLEKSPVDMLPDQVLTFETTARHSIPGQEKQAAEAIYQTLNMNLESLTKISVYERVEGYPTEEDARKRATELLAPYPTDRANLVINGITPARAGYTPNLGAYAVVWTKGQYVTFAKALFRDTPPAQKRSFLSDQSNVVTKATDTYQRTGAQGAQLPTNQ